MHALFPQTHPIRMRHKGDKRNISVVIVEYCLYEVHIDYKRCCYLRSNFGALFLDDQGTF